MTKHNKYRCSSDCSTVETGFTCPTAGSACDPICGDGIYVIGEGCDDGNPSSSDGCYKCSEESGWDCPHVGSSVDICHTVCGDGMVRGSEGCDDGNTSSGDG